MVNYISLFLILRYTILLIILIERLRNLTNVLGQTRVTKKSDGNSENGLLYIVKDISEVNKDTFLKENMNPQLQKRKLIFRCNIEF